MRTLDSILTPRLDSPLAGLDFPRSPDVEPLKPVGKSLSHRQKEKLVQRNPPRPTPPSSQRTGLRVLVVDDNQIALAVTRRMLQCKFPHLLLGGGAVYARSGTEALERAQQEVFDVILLDMHMPAPYGPDGLHCAQAIRDGLPGKAGEANRLAHLVAVTSDAGSEHRETYRPLLDGLIPKPVRLGHLQLFLESLQEEAEWAEPFAPRLDRPQADTVPLPPSPPGERIFFDASDEPWEDPQLYPSQLHRQTVNSLASLASTSFPPTPRLETSALERLTIAAVDGNLLRGTTSPVPSLVDDADDLPSPDED